jgi:hypothetical protein
LRLGAGFLLGVLVSTLHGGESGDTGVRHVDEERIRLEIREEVTIRLACFVFVVSKF